ncbi:MAG: oligosaccharide flippase family protein [Rhodothermales bacterium]|nr:oligosaccharide flippase family protein [Rhodothermales bacterium]
MKFFRRYSITPASEFSGSVLTLLSGAAGALMVSYLFQPVLTRLYTPTEFGIFDSFVAILALLIPLASVKYEDAIVLPEEDGDAGHLLTLSILILFLSTAVLTAVIYFLPTFGIGNVLIERRWLLLLPVALILVRFSMLGELWNIRYKTFKTISAVSVSRSASTNFVKLGAYTSGTSGLFFGYIAGFTLAVSIYAAGIVRAVRLSLHDGLREGVVRVARRYKNFPRYTMPASLLASLVGRLPFLLLLYFFSPEIVGLFGRAFAAIMVPLSVVGTAVSNVFYVFAAERRNTPHLASSSAKVFDRLVLFGLFPSLAILLAGPQIFGFVFGSDWTASGDFARIIAIWLLLSAVTSPLTRLFDVLERQRLELITAGVLFVLQTAALIVGGLSGNPATALIYLAVSGSIGRLIQLAILFRIAGVQVADIAATTQRYVGRSLPGTILIALSLLDGRPLVVIIATIAGAAIYGLLSLRDLLEAFKKPGASSIE